MKKHVLLFGIIFCFIKPLSAQLENIDPVYLNSLKGRTAKIVEALEIADSAKWYRVQEIIIIQYYELSKIHDLQKSKLEESKNLVGEAKEQAKKIAQTETEASLYKLHAKYLAELSSELTQDQVAKVKDGMTYGVVERTYNGYLSLLPELTDEQKRYLYKNLVEAREFAMDAGTSDEKHAWFGKYKGRINNYLSKEGYDLKKAEKESKSK